MDLEGDEEGEEEDDNGYGGRWKEKYEAPEEKNPHFETNFFSLWGIFAFLISPAFLLLFLLLYLFNLFLLLSSSLPPIQDSDWKSFL